MTRGLETQLLVLHVLDLSERTQVTRGDVALSTAL